MAKGLHSRSKYNETLTRRRSTWIHHQKAVTQRFFLWMINDVNSGEKNKKRKTSLTQSRILTLDFKRSVRKLWRVEAMK